MRILLDQNIPEDIRTFLPGHGVSTAAEMGWSTVSNGALLAAAELAGFEVMITADQSIRYQQNLSGRRICLVVLSTNAWGQLLAQQQAIRDAVDQAGQKTYVDVKLDRPALRRRPPPNLDR